MKILFPFKHHNPTSILHCLSFKSYHHQITRVKSLLSTAIQSKSINHVAQIHAQIIVNGYFIFPFLINTLVSLYSKCGDIAKSILLFSKTPAEFKNVVSWTALMTQLARHEMGIETLVCLNRMRGSGVCPNEFTFSAVLPACALNPLNGGQIHGLIKKYGFDCDVYVGSALVDMYGKCFDPGSAYKVFDEMPRRNIVSWNSLIVGCLGNKLYDEAVLSFKGLMEEVSVSPDQVSLSSVLTACANMEWGLQVGKQVHGAAVKYGLLGLAYVKNSLMDMYCKSGSFVDAARLFRTIHDKDVVTWNVMMMGFVQNDDFEEAFKYFVLMRSKQVLPDEASFSTALHASAGLAALYQGMLIHNQVIKLGFVANTCVASSLITMYTRCGSLFDAHRVFQEIKDRNVVCWTAMIAAFQLHGHSRQVIELFESMLQEGIKPDYITFVCVLSACAHTGQVEEGFAYFGSMTTVHGMNPGHEHYACMVDLLSRAGKLEEAKRFVESMPLEPDASVWGSLLGACRNHGNLEMGREVAERLFEIEPHNPGNYVILSNMYARKGELKKADEIRRLMGVNNVRKAPGCSWIDVQDTTFVFTVNDKSHPRTDEIYEILTKLKGLVKKKGYVAETQFAVNDVEEYKEQSLWVHSEKLALAFGLLALPAGAPIRIKKNLRTCGDCHTVMKFASKIFEREIIVRDMNRFHHFTNGHCSCRDYW